MKKKVLMVLLAATLSVSMIAGCGSKGDNNTDTTKTESKQDSDQEAADKVAKLIDDIYVQERTDKTDEQCTAAKEAWDALTDAQKELVEGEDADPDYFGRDTGDASKDDPLNADEIGENEILVVSFGTSFNDSRATDIGGIEKAVQAAYPDWSVRRAFTAQIIIKSRGRYPSSGTTSGCSTGQPHPRRWSGTRPAQASPYQRCAPCPCRRTSGTRPAS